MAFLCSALYSLHTMSPGCKSELVSVSESVVANRPAARALITRMYRSVGRISTYKPQNRQEFVTQMNNKAASICKTIELPGDKQPGL